MRFAEIICLGNNKWCRHMCNSETRWWMYSYFYTSEWTTSAFYLKCWFMVHILQLIGNQGNIYHGNQWTQFIAIIALSLTNRETITIRISQSMIMICGTYSFYENARFAVLVIMVLIYALFFAPSRILGQPEQSQDFPLRRSNPKWRRKVLIQVMPWQLNGISMDMLRQYKWRSYL